MADERILELEGQLQNLKLELAAERKKAERFKDEVDRLRGGETARQAAAQIERLMTDTAAPVSQLLTQNHLLRVENRPVGAGDVLAIAVRLVRALEDHGLKAEGSVGETAGFNPNLHEAISVDSDINPGDHVTIRLPGISYQGKLLKKAGVIVSNQ